MPIFKRLPDQFISDTSIPYENGYLYIGEYGKDPKTNPISIYNDDKRETRLDNPQRLDSFGRPQNDIHLFQDYSYSVEDASNNSVENRSVRLSDIVCARCDTITIAVLGASESVYPFINSFARNIDRAFRDEGINATVAHCGRGGLTYSDALNSSDTLTGHTPVEMVNDLNPDMIILELGFNDIFTAGKSAAQIQSDADAVFSSLTLNNPNAVILYSRTFPYDHSRHHRLAPSSIKKKMCIPFMHGPSTAPGESSLFTSESAVLEDIISTINQTKIETWRTIDAYIRTKGFINVNTDFFKIARLGFNTFDRLHIDSTGQRLLARIFWEVFQKDSTLRESIPTLQKIKDMGTSTFDEIWSSAVALDPAGDGYVLDPKYLDGIDYPEFLYGLSNYNLAAKFATWGNNHSPAIYVTPSVNKSVNELLAVTMQNAPPGVQVRAKVWKTTAPEPALFGPGPTPLFISDSGSFLSATPDLTDLLDTGSWHVKYSLDGNVYGPFQFNILGSTAKALGRRRALAQATANQSFTQPGTALVNLHTLDDPDNLISSFESSVMRLPSSSGSEYRITGAINGSYAVDAELFSATFRKNGSMNHDYGACDRDSYSRNGSDASFNFVSPWIPLSEDVEIEMVMVNSAGGMTTDTTRGIWLQIEVR